jgi:hypothetical protein
MVNHVVADTHERLTRIATLFRRVLFESALQIKSETEGEVPASRSPAYARNGEVDSVSGACGPWRRGAGPWALIAPTSTPQAWLVQTKADEPILSNYVRSAPEQGGDHCSVGPAHPGSGSAPLEYRQLVAQDQDLDLLGGVGSGAQHEPAQELEEHLVGQPQRHRRIMPGSR